MKKVSVFGLAVAAMTLGAISHAYVPGKFYYEKKGEKEKVIALTFDDGPGPWTPKFLELLKKHNIRATFFMEGDQFPAQAHYAKDVKDAGHEIANHTFNHINFNLVENAHPEKFLKELKDTEAVIEKATGVKTKAVRLPYGALGKRNNMWMLSTLKDQGYSLVHWSFGTDWLLKKSADQMAREYIAAARPGAVFLFHDGGRKREKTYDALVQVLDVLEKQGYRFIPAEELFKD